MRKKTTKPRKKRRAKKQRGEPHVPTEATRAAVQALAAAGEKQDQICEYLTKMMHVKCGSKHTLEKHYRTELDLAKTHQKLMVSQGLYRKAVGTPATYDKDGNKIRDEVKPEVTAQIFWLKCQGGWVEPSRFGNSGSGDEKGLSLEDLVHLSYQAGAKAKKPEEPPK